MSWWAPVNEGVLPKTGSGGPLRALYISCHHFGSICTPRANVPGPVTRAVSPWKQAICTLAPFQAFISTLQWDGTLSCACACTPASAADASIESVMRASRWPDIYRRLVRTLLLFLHSDFPVGVFGFCRHQHTLRLIAALFRMHDAKAESLLPYVPRETAEGGGGRLAQTKQMYQATRKNKSRRSGKEWLMDWREGRGDTVKMTGRLELRGGS